MDAAPPDPRPGPSPDAPPGPLHEAAAFCAAPPAAALRHLATAAGMAQWCLGLMDGLHEVRPGLLHGRSRFDGAAGYCRPEVDVPAGRVIYHLGAAADALQPRIEAQVQPALGTDGAPGCRVVLRARRTAGMDAARWQRLVASHECEVLLIQQQLARSSG